jgi:hypothetical protein
LTMAVLNWVSLPLLLAAIVLWVVARSRSRSSSLRAMGLLLAGLILQTLSSIVGDSTVGIAFLLLTLPCLLAGGVLTVREARATWRQQMERVKHL